MILPLLEPAAEQELLEPEGSLSNLSDAVAVDSWMP